MIKFHSLPKSTIIILATLLFLSGCGPSPPNNIPEQNNMSKQIRLPANAGQFYEADPSLLSETVLKYLDNIKDIPVKNQIQAAIVPHASHVFSGQTAAYVYKALSQQIVKRVILIGNSHTDLFDGIAVDDNDAWQTPLGEVMVDKEFAQKLVAADNIIHFNSQVHASDHILEVQLPFLQASLKSDFKIIPLVFGNTQPEDYLKLAQALTSILEANDVIIASSDLSHYPPYNDAVAIDTKTLAIISQLDPEKLSEHVTATMSQNISNEQTLLCGATAVKTVMALARQLNWSGQVLNYSNSGDSSFGDKASVVGYGAVIFTTNKETAETSQLLNKDQQAELLSLAKQTVTSYVSQNKIPDFNITDEKLNKKQGAFVTLSHQGQLRGCIGQILPGHEPLWQTVRDMAIAACSQDFRFTPVTTAELPSLDYEISVLAPPQSIDNWRDIKLGEHGVIVSKNKNRGVFLPQVADETGWDLETFLANLCAQKAGLPEDCYKNDPAVELKIFTAQVF